MKKSPSSSSSSSSSSVEQPPLGCFSIPSLPLRPQHPKPKAKRIRRAPNPQQQGGIDIPVRRSSMYRGVTRHRWTGRFEAHLWDKFSMNNQKKKGKQVYLGAYDDEEAAAHTYDLAAIKFWGPDTFLNFPLNTYSKHIEQMEEVTREEYLAILRRGSSGFSRGLSKFRGVARHHHNGRWEARIGRVHGNKYLYLGTYGTQEEAAVAYDLAAIKYRGANAVTNFNIRNYIGQPPQHEESPVEPLPTQPTVPFQRLNIYDNEPERMSASSDHIPAPKLFESDVQSVASMNPTTDPYAAWGMWMVDEPLLYPNDPLENINFFDDNIDNFFGGTTDVGRDEEDQGKGIDWVEYLNDIVASGDTTVAQGGECGFMGTMVNKSMSPTLSTATSGTQDSFLFPINIYS